MADPQCCPKCGAELPAGAPPQPCPACLMKMGLNNASEPAAALPETFAAGSAGAFQAPSAAELAPLFPQMEVLELLGQGGMGAVYKARQKSLDRIVAIKIINPQAAGDPNFAERFTREAKALARLNHPNIVTVHDFGRAGDLYFFIMEYVDGANVRRLLREGSLEPPSALQIVPPLCDALQYAHDEGIVHRDIKPENVLVDARGRVKIADFGLAKLLGRGPADVTLTAAHQAMGTLHYMAPEQMERPQEVDHRSDIYALGVTFYEMLTGELPLGRFAPPSKKVHVDVRLDEVVLKALEREPARRYQRASDVKTAVESCSDRSTPAGSNQSAADHAAIKRQLKGPAIGLIATGIVNWVGAPIALLVLWGVLGEEFTLPQEALGWIAVCVYLAAGVMILAGLKMMQCRAYWLAVFASSAAMVINPGNLIGLPIGLWSLVVLSSKEIRAAFRHRGGAWGETNEADGRARRLLNLAVQLVVGAVLAAIGVGMTILGATLSPAGADVWWWFMSIGFASAVAGVSWVVNCWSRYRRFVGCSELAEQPGWFWLDWLLSAYALLGAAIAVGVAAAAAAGRFGEFWPGLGLATVALTQSGMLLVWRSSKWRAVKAPQQAPTLLERRLLVLAVGIVGSTLILMAGIAAVVAGAFFEPGAKLFWGLIAAGGGGVVGGGGSLIGLLKTHRDWTRLRA